jgi:hypothetical protein
MNDFLISFIIKCRNNCTATTTLNGRALKKNIVSTMTSFNT